MATRKIPVMMMDGQEYMMTPEEAQTYFNGLQRTDEGAMLIPGGNLVSTGLSKIGGPLSKYFGNLFGTTAKRTAGNVAKSAENIAANFAKKVNDARRLNQARAGSNSIPNLIKETGAKIALETGKKTGNKLARQSVKLDKANKIAQAAKTSARIKTGAGAAGVGLVAADALGNRGGRDENGTVVPSQAVADLVAIADGSYQGGGIGYDDASENPLTMNGSRRGSGSYNAQDGARNVLTKKVLKPGSDIIMRDTGIPITDAVNPYEKLDALDDYDNYVADKVTADVTAPEPVAKKTVAVPKKTKKRTASGSRKSVPAKRSAPIAKKAPVQRKAATADPLNLFGNKNGYNPFSNKERQAAGQDRLSFTDFFKRGVGTR